MIKIKSIKETKKIKLQMLRTYLFTNTIPMYYSLMNKSPALKKIEEKKQ